MISDYRSQIIPKGSHAQRFGTDHKLYTISEVAEKLNLSTKTLRRWEENGKFTASRTIGGQRRYTLEDLQILDAIKHGTLPSKSDLLTLQQAANLFGVTPQTIVRWENEGKIHPFITSGNTYYPKSRLIEKVEHLKQISTSINNQQQPTPSSPSSTSTPNPDPSHQTEFISPNPTTSLPRNLNPETPVGTPLAKGEIWGRDLIYTTLINFLLTLFLLLGYHVIFNSGSHTQETQVKGAEITQTPLQRTLQSIFSLTGDLNTPGSISTRDKLTAGKSFNLLPSTRPLQPTPGTVYYDASSQTFKFFTQKHWFDFPSQALLKPTNATLISGTATISKGKTKSTVTQATITPSTNVIITFTNDYSPAKKYWLTQKQGSFTLHTDFPPAKDATFTYLIFNSDKPQPHI